MAAKRKMSGKATKRGSRSGAPKLKKQRGKTPKVTALVHSSERDRTAAKSGISKTGKRQSGPATSSGAAARDFPDAVYEDDRRS